MSRRPPLTHLLFAISGLFLTGCGGTVDQKNFEKLKVGMSSQQVQAILGKDSKEISAEEVTALMREALSPAGGQDGKAGKIELPDLSGARGVRWGDDKKWITVIFMGDRASRIFKKGF
jgi:hypothetical protein